MKRTLSFILLITCTLAARAQILIINEVMPANLGEVLDPSCNYGGWIELYNPGTTAVSLSGMTLTDHKGHTHKLTAKHGSVPAKGFKNLWFGHYGSDTAPNGSPASYGTARYANQIDFKLDCDGGTITLTKSGKEQASLTYPAAISRCSWARTTDGGETWSHCAAPTAEKSNAGAPFATERLAAPEPNHSGGKVSGNTKFSVSIPDGARLYYTTDGSVPTLESKSAAADASGNATLTATPGSIYRMRAMADGFLPSRVVTRTFLPEQTTVTTPEGWEWDEDRWDYVYKPASTYKMDIKGFTIVSVTTDERYLYDEDLGIFSRGNGGGWSFWGYGNYFEDWDRPANVEIFAPEGIPMLNQEMEMCVSGGLSRTYDLKSFKLKSSKACEGVNYVEAFGLFPDKPYNRYKDFMVRAGGQTLFLRHLDNALQVMAQRSGLYLDCQAYRPAFIFINGKFQEIMLLREPTNKQYGYANYGMDTDFMDTLEESDITATSVTSGTQAAFNALLSASATCATSESNWQKVQALLDIDEYANYFAIESYLDNKDWPQNNVKMFREKSADDDPLAEGTGRFHAVLQDLDWTFGDLDENAFTRIEEGANYPYAVAGHKENPMVTLFLNLMKRAEFRKRFVDSFCLVAGSVYDPTYVAQTVDALCAEMEKGYPASTKADVLTQLNSLKSYLSSNWQKKRITYLRSWQRASSSTTDVVTASISTSCKDARIMLNGMTVPRNAFSGTLFLPITLKAEAHRGQKFAGWKRDGNIVSSESTYTLTKGGTYEAVFSPDEEQNMSVVINEVGAANGIYQSERLKRSDWLELYNCTDAEIDLAGMTLTDGGSKVAILQGTIPAHGYRVLWADGENLPFKLANADNTLLTLTDASGEEIDRFFYHKHTSQQSVGRWPDGGESIYCFDRPSLAKHNFLTSYAKKLEFDESLVGVAATAPTSQPEAATPAEYDIAGRLLQPTKAGRSIIVSPSRKVLK